VLTQTFCIMICNSSVMHGIWCFIICCRKRGAFQKFLGIPPPEVCSVVLHQSVRVGRMIYPPSCVISFVTIERRVREKGWHLGR